MRDKGTLAKNIEKFCEKLREAYLRMNSSDEASLRLSGDDVITKREFVYFMMYPETAVDGSKTVPSTLAEFQEKIEAMSWANDFFMAKSAFRKLEQRVGDGNVLEAGADDLYKGLTELRAIFHPADVRPQRRSSSRRRRARRQWSPKRWPRGPPRAAARRPPSRRRLRRRRRRLREAPLPRQRPAGAKSRSNRWWPPSSTRWASVRAGT